MAEHRKLNSNGWLTKIDWLIEQSGGVQLNSVNHEVKSVNDAVKSVNDTLKSVND